MSAKLLVSLDIILVITIWQACRVTGIVSNVKITGPSFVDEGSTDSFLCSGSCTNGTCEYMWPAVSGLISPTTGNRISISNIKRKPGGGKYNIICTVSDKNNRPESDSHSLDVYYPPDVNATWDTGTHTITCLANGMPQIYTFKKWVHIVNSITIQELNGKQNGNRFTYQFATPMSYQDRGDYKCLVGNGRPSSDVYKESVATVTADEKPLSLPAENSYNVSKGAKLHVEILIYAIPEVKGSDVTVLDNASETISTTSVPIQINPHLVTVAFHGKNVNVTGQKVTLTFRSVLEEYFGHIKVNIENAKGSINKSIRLYPEGAPDPPEGLQVKDVLHDKSVLTLRSGFFNGADQTFVVEYRTAEEGSQWANGSSVFAGEQKNISLSATISDLSPETSYMFRAYGYNIYNKSEYTEIVNATTLEAPSQLAVILGATFGAVSFVVVTIVVVIVIYRYRRKDKQDDKAVKGGSAQHEEEYKAEEPVSPTGEDNPIYDGQDSPRNLYDNQAVKNGRIVQPYGQGEYVGLKEEPIYMNNQQSSFSPDSENLIAQEGYLDLAGDNKEQIEEAYATKDITKLAKTPSEDSEYLPMDVVKGSATPKTNRSLERTPSKPRYCNVSQQIGLLGQSGNNNDGPEEAYVDMDITARLKPSKSWNALSNTGSRPNNVKSPSDDTYVSMNSKTNPKDRARNTQKGPKETSQYQNLHEQGVFDKQTRTCLNQDPYISMTAKKSDRDSMPAYEAPLPPFVEEDYMNINLGKKK